jgi:hypothetical protein
VPAWREEGFGLEVPCLGREKERLSGGNDSAQAKVRVQECLADQVCAVESWVGAGRGWVGKDRVRGGIFEREERVGEVIDGVGDAVCPCLGDKDMVATIVKEGRGDVETPNAVMIPRLALRGRVVDHYKLSGGVDAVCREIHGRPVEAVPGGEGRVWSERAQVIEG